MTAEYAPNPEQDPSQTTSLFGSLAVRLHDYFNPSREELEARSWRSFEKRWNKYGRKGFIVIHSAEGSMATPESARGFRPADASDPADAQSR